MFAQVKPVIRPQGVEVQGELEQVFAAVIGGYAQLWAPPPDGFCRPAKGCQLLPFHVQLHIGDRPARQKVVHRLHRHHPFPRLGEGAVPPLFGPEPELPRLAADRQVVALQIPIPLPLGPIQQAAVVFGVRLHRDGMGPSPGYLLQFCQSVPVEGPQIQASLFSGEMEHRGAQILRPLAGAAV